MFKWILVVVYRVVYSHSIRNISRCPCGQNLRNSSRFSTPQLKILEQPTNRIRYRYRSEKGSHGGLTGENSSQNKKTYPTVKLENYHSTAQVYIRASLYTNEERPKSHVHKLMGRHCNEEGHCTVPLSDNMIATFQNLGILFVGKKEVPDILYRRKLEETQVLHTSFISANPSLLSVREESERDAKDMNLNSVKICFEAFVYENDMSYAVSSPIFSRPVANQKSPDSGELKIVRMDKYCGPATGDEEVFLLCEKVNKKEIKIRFFETDSDGHQLWESFANFTEADVHHQVAIVFRTPPYRDQNIKSSVQVYVQLFRPRDGEYSEGRPFTYKPKEHDLDGVEKKRRKISHYNSGVEDISNNSNNGGNSGFVGNHSFTSLADSSHTTQSSRDSNNNNIGYYGHSSCSHDSTKRENCLQIKSNHLNRNYGPNRRKANLIENSITLFVN
ncbi:unnamed protein product [Oppiella nova]|uniref:RHD domain-containing protein n=1 Tax=Oppiella nova TaxID=334625 RepID=A0A7R9QQR4_9ACAR|nr:unnamed protein product [Oppiella nova]CAG2172011.1 unnamed protein product [Oppiella nova]